MLENIMLSFRGIRSHKMRSALTMLGIIIGIAAIIIIVSIINGASEQLKEEMVGDSTNTVRISLYSKDDRYTAYDPTSSGTIPGITTISEDSVNAVKQLDGITAAAAIYCKEFSLEVKYLTQSSWCTTLGVGLDFLPLTDKLLSEGRLFTERDYANRNNVAVISDSVASTIFNDESPIGKTIQIGSELFTVIGVVTKPVDYSEIETLSDYMMKLGIGEKSVMIPYTSWNDAAGYDDIQSLVIEIEDRDEIVKASTEAANILNTTLADAEKYEYKSGSLTEDADYLKEIMKITSLLLVGIASISLLVGGIGVMNIMLVSVTERTREIGLKKALGAKRRVILGQFLTESVVLTSLGGLIGVLIGIGIAKLIGIIIGMATVISVGAIAVSVGFSMGVGIIFGLVPSIKAANLNPIDALRYE